MAAGPRPVVGYLLAFSHPAFHANAPVAWVEEVLVAAPARGTGVGRLLMVAAEAWGRSTGAAYIALATRRAAPLARPETLVAGASAPPYPELRRILGG